MNEIRQTKHREANQKENMNEIRQTKHREANQKENMNEIRRDKKRTTDRAKVRYNNSNINYMLNYSTLYSLFYYFDVDF
jgi:ribosomal protein L2